AVSRAPSSRDRYSRRRRNRAAAGRGGGDRASESPERFGVIDRRATTTGARDTGTCSRRHFRCNSTVRSSPALVIFKPGTSPGALDMTSVASLSGAGMGWKGSEIDYREHGLHLFSEAELAEIERGLRHLLALRPRDFTDVTPASFPLERLGDCLRAL